MRNAIEFSNTILNKIQSNSRIAVISVVGSLFFCLGIAAAAFWFVTTNMQTVYVLSENGAIESARRQDRATTIRDEVYNQVETMHELLFNLAPDKELIGHHKSRVVELGDRSIMEYWNKRDEDHFYSRLVDNNTSEEIKLEELVIDCDSYPYRALYRGFIYILREETITKYDFESTCQIIQSSRTAGNLHGLTVEKFHVSKMEKVETRRRQRFN